MTKAVMILLGMMLFAELGHCAPNPRPTLLKALDSLKHIGGNPKSKRDSECPRITCAGKGGACGRSTVEDVIDTCKWGYFCEVVDFTTPPKCAAFHKDGADCGLLGNACKPPAECVDEKCKSPGIGSPCNEAEECPDALLCVAGKCAAGSYAKAGEACDDNRGPKCNHPDGYTCSEDDVCIKTHTKKLGDDCDEDVECPWAALCTNRKCVWPWLSKGKGESCITMECKQGLVCTDTEDEPGTCVEPGTVPEGQKCTSNADCGESGMCECNSNLGHDACFKRVEFSQKLMDETIEMAKCLEKSGFSNKGLFDCSMEHADLAKKIQPAVAVCMMPGDSSRNAVTLIWLPFVALVMRLLQ